MTPPHVTIVTELNPSPAQLTAWRATWQRLLSPVEMVTPAGDAGAKNDDAPKKAISKASKDGVAGHHGEQRC